MDHLTQEIAKTLAAGYCPTSKTLFLVRLASLSVAFVAIALGLFAVARRAIRNASWKPALRTCAWVLIVFTIGAVAINIFGLSGCGQTTLGGLEREWPF